MEEEIIKDTEYVYKPICPECGAELIPEGRCLHCDECGWSACSV